MPCIMWMFYTWIWDFKIAGTWFKASLGVRWRLTKYLKRYICVYVCVWDIPLTVNWDKARPCPALLCAMHSYRPSSSTDACPISHNAVADFLMQRHTRTLATATRPHFTPYSIRISDTCSGSRFNHKSASLRECNWKQSQGRIDALLIFQDDTIKYVMFTKLTVYTNLLTNEPIKHGQC